MKRDSGKTMLAAIVAGALIAPACLADMNVALNAEVTLHGNFFTGGWGGGQTVSGDSIVDGVFLPEQTQWDQGPVWWDERDYMGRRIEINLGRLCQIDSLLIQADNNDGYDITYWNAPTSQWWSAWLVPSQYAYGVVTRPEYLLPSPLITDELWISGFHWEGDWLYAVSEIQAFGSVVPVPGAVLLGAIGLSCAGWRLRRTTS